MKGVTPPFLLENLSGHVSLFFSDFVQLVKHAKRKNMDIALLSPIETKVQPFPANCFTKTSINCEV